MPTEHDVRLEWGACTDRGLRRARNEDAFVAARPVFFVADGMGGHDAGDVASHAALDGFQAMAGRAVAEVAEVEAAFLAAVAAVDAIATGGSAAGTTLAGAALCRQDGVPYWLILNIGDSRVYLLRGGRFDQISVDHSAVQVLVDSGVLDAAQAHRHPQRNVVTRAVGAGSTGVPDFWMLPVETDDRLLVCSDGLSKELDAAGIRRALTEEPAPRAAAERLVHEALLHGGRDNVTVIVVDACDVPVHDDDPTLPGVEVDDDTVPRGRDTEVNAHADR